MGIKTAPASQDHSEIKWDTSRKLLLLKSDDDNYEDDATPF